MAPTAGTILRMKKASVKPVKKTHSVKNQIRGLKRLLSRPSLNDELRQQKQSELQDLEAKLSQTNSVQKEKKIATKYRMVKFFERRKLIRQLKGLRTSLTKDSISEDHESELKKQEASILDSLKYIFFFPKGVKYISLFPKRSPEEKVIKMQDKLKQEAVDKFANGDDEVKDLFQAFCDATQSSRSNDNDDECTNNDDFFQ